MAAKQHPKADDGLDAPGVVVGNAAGGAAALAGAEIGWPPGAGTAGCRRRCWAAGWPPGACFASPKPDS